MSPQLSSKKSELKLPPHLIFKAKVLAVTLAVAAIGATAKELLFKKEMTPRAELPKEFTLQEEWFTAGTDFILQDSKGAFGSLDQKVLNFASTIEYKDSKGEVLATAKKEIISWGSKVNVFDNHNVKIGSIEEVVFESLLKFQTSYKILDAQGNVLGTSKKVSFGDTTFTINDSSGTPVIEMKKPFLDLVKASWDCKVLTDERKIDSRLIVFIPAFKTLADNARSSE